MPTITQQHIQTLEDRAHALAERVESATRNHPDRDVRQGGSKLAEVLEEWLDEIHDLHAEEDEDLSAKVLSFRLRLTLAEKKVETWPSGEKKKRKKAA